MKKMKFYYNGSIPLCVASFFPLILCIVIATQLKEMVIALIIGYLGIIIFSLIFVIGITSISQTLVFGKDKITVFSFPKRKIHFYYDEISYVAIVEFITKKGLIKSRWIALERNNMEETRWVEEIMDGPIRRNKRFTVNYSKEREVVFFDHFKNRKLIRVDEETGQVIRMFDISDSNVEKGEK